MIEERYTRNSPRKHKTECVIKQEVHEKHKHDQPEVLEKQYVHDTEEVHQAKIKVVSAPTTTTTTTTNTEISPRPWRNLAGSSRTNSKCL